MRSRLWDALSVSMAYLCAEIRRLLVLFRLNLRGKLVECDNKRKVGMYTVDSMGPSESGFMYILTLSLHLLN